MDERQQTSMKRKADTVEFYRQQNKSAAQGKIVFAGSSLMEGFPINKLLEEHHDGTTIYNRGVAGFVTAELEQALDVCVLDLKPARLFINIGTNDLNDPDLAIEELTNRYKRILKCIVEELPCIEVYLMAYYPVNPNVATGFMKEVLAARSNERIEQANLAVKALAAQMGMRYIDVNAALKDENGLLRSEYTIEGLHLNEGGYRAIYDDCELCMKVTLNLENPIFMRI